MYYDYREGKQWQKKKVYTEPLAKVGYFCKRLLSYNFTHLGEWAHKKLQKYNDVHNLWTPLLVIPEAILNLEEEKTNGDIL